MAECFASFRRGRGVCGGCSNDVVSAGRAEGEVERGGKLVAFNILRSWPLSR